MEWELLAADRSSSPSSSGCRRLSAAVILLPAFQQQSSRPAVPAAGSRRRVAGAAIAVLAATHWTLTKLRPSPPPRTAAVVQLSACLLLQLLPGSVHAQEIVFSRHRNSQPSTTTKDRVYYSSLFSGAMILNCLLLESGDLMYRFSIGF